MGWMTGFRFLAGARVFSLRHMGSAVHSASYPMFISSGVKLPGRETGHSLPSNAKVYNSWRYNSDPPVRLHGVLLGLAQGQFLHFIPAEGHGL